MMKSPHFGIWECVNFFFVFEGCFWYINKSCLTVFFLSAPWRSHFIAFKSSWFLIKCQPLNLLRFSCTSWVTFLLQLLKVSLLTTMCLHIHITSSLLRLFNCILTFFFELGTHTTTIFSNILSALYSLCTLLGTLCLK